MYTSRTRMTGFSGMDIDSMVSQLMKAESMKLHREQRSLISLQWKQDAYRSVADKLKEFNTKHIDVTNSRTSMLLSTAFRAFNTTVKNTNGTDATALSVEALSTAKPGNYEVSVISRAQAPTYTGEKVVVKSSEKTGAQITAALYDSTSDPETDPTNFSFLATFANRTEKITIDNQAISDAREALPDADDQAILERAINNQLEAAFGKEFKPDSSNESLRDGTAETQPKLRVAIDDNGLRFETTGASTFSIGEFDESFMEATGLKDGATNDPTVQTLNYFLPADGWDTESGKQVITIGEAPDSQGVMKPITLEVSKDETVKQLMDKMNAQSDKTGARVSFDKLTSSFKFESVTSGLNADRPVVDGEMFADGPNVFADIFNITSGSSYQRGQDAIVTITDLNAPEGSDRQRILQSDSNVISEDPVTGLKFTINNATPDDAPILIKIDKNDEHAFDNIKAFVDSYNELLQSLKADVNTTRAKSDKYTHYEPLLDEEKQALTEKQVEEMESKAKEGILNRDPILNKIIQQMQAHITAAVPLPGGGSISLFDIGIDTSSDWTKGGELVIKDEAKLRAALANSPADVETLFSRNTGVSTGTTIDNGGLNDKFQNEGVARRMQTIIELATHSTYGTIAKHAGIEGTATFGTNELRKTIDDKNDRISRMIELLERKENDYYAKFSAMEAAMVKGENQMNSLLAQLGM